MNQLTPQLILSVVGIYFVVLMLVAYFTSRGAKNQDFFNASKQSPWYLVAFGMIGASLSGVTFISIPGVVGGGGTNMGLSYMQVVFGYLLGYTVIALVLMPVYYKLNLTSIYTYLERRFGTFSYKTGAAFFILSRVIGASFRLFLVAIVLQQFVTAPLGIPFPVTVLGIIVLIWVYTFQGGIKTIVWTDSLQTFCMLAAVILTIFAIGDAMNLSVGGLITKVKTSEYSQLFFFEGGWADKNNFFKQFLGGASIAIVMTGLDQDMMQKNLSCKNLGDAQKNVFWFSVVLLFANLLFLALGALLYIYAGEIAMEIPTRNGEVARDLLYPTIALEHLSPTIGIVFILGLIAAAYSSADSALTSLTTSFCVDFLDFNKEKNSNKSEVKQRNIRRIVHIGFSILLFLVILLFYYINDSSVINQLFKIAGYTYGPLLGLYAFGFFMKPAINDRLAPMVCIAAPILTFVINFYSKQLLFGYSFGFELLILNGLITFVGLLLISKKGSNGHSEIHA
ncbi:MAG: sodium:solute symporter [Saprospiraceae bacterium]